MSDQLLALQQDPRITELVESAKMEINTRQDAEQSMIVKNMIIKLEKEVEDIRKGLVKPHNDIVKQINVLAKSISEPLGLAKKELNKKQIEHNNRIEAEAEKLRQEMQELGQGLDAQEEVQAEIDVINREASREKVQKGINYNKKIIKVDWDKLPKQYWNIKDMEITPDQLRIKKDMKAGIRIDGIVFEE